MKLALILTIALAGNIHLGCRQADHNKAPQPATQVDPTLIRTENRTIIKKAGWQVPVSLPEEKTFHATTVIIDGRAVKVLNFPFFPTEKLEMKFPKFTDDGEVEYKVTQILEFTDERKKPYCYQFFAEDDVPVYSGVTTYFSYRDDDGDGVFETLGESCSVPAWVN